MKSTYLLEASWEVCNKVGGIHTVLTSKLPFALRDFPDHYLALGPYIPGLPHPEFLEADFPKEIAPIASTLESMGIGLHYGNWIEGHHAPTILLDWSGLIPNLNNYKARLWEQHQLDTLGSDFYDLDQPLLWSTAVGIFAETFAHAHPESVILHVHEWLAGGALLSLPSLPNLRTVFTTHATVLGRALASDPNSGYPHLEGIDATQAALTHGVRTKHRLEQCAAQIATIFTTVSHLTADEATYLLGRKPEVVTENGIDTAHLPSLENILHQHTERRELLNDLAAAYFFPSYHFDLAETTHQFTMGRYEVRNKGYDLYIRSLANLNKKLKDEGSKKTVIAWLLVPGDVAEARPEALRQFSAYRGFISELYQEVTDRRHSLYRNLQENRDSASLPLRAEVFQSMRTHLPRYEELPASLYTPRHPEQDTFLQLLQQNGLRNREEDRVKVLLAPVYLDGFDGIFNLPLYNLLPAFDLGVFPSWYEPWGYTPMESLAFGVPAITSTLAGFGLSVKAGSGVFILDRTNAENSAETNLNDILYTAATTSRPDWLQRRLSAHAILQAFSWEKLYSTYEQTYDLLFK